MLGLMDDIDLPPVRSVGRMPGPSGVGQHAACRGCSQCVAAEVTQPDSRGVQRGLHREGLAGPAAVMGQHELAGVEMEAGCFNCSCGTCAIEIVSGMENIEPPTDEELNVLDQWNKDPDKYRLTCCVKILKGEVVIQLEH